MKKVLSTLMATVLSLTACAALGACGGKENDPNTIYVYNFNGGYGSAWLEKAKIAYETLHPDITVKINKQKPLSALSSTDVATGRDELWFSDMTPYYTFWADGVVDSISTALTTPNPYDDGKTIESKLSDSQKQFFKINGGDYYAVPHYSGFMGLVYNVDTFEQNGFYIKKDKPNVPYAQDPDGYFTSYPDEFSDGPDGEDGTYDDGLPATYEEFLYLLDFMSRCGLMYTDGKSPLIGTGANNEQYFGETMYSFMTDYMGYDQMMLNFTFNGNATSLGKIVDGEFVLDSQPTKIENGNGYELARQAGKYYTYDLFNKIFSNKNYYDETVMASSTFTVQDASRRLARGEAGVLMEGVWWEGDSENVFWNLGQKTKHDYRFAVMPFPKATADKVGTKTTLYDHLFSTCFMKKGLSEDKKAKVYDFIQFVYSDAQLVEFTATTGTLKALNYEIPEPALAGLTHYEKTLVDYYQKSDVLYPCSSNPLYVNNNNTAFRSYYYMAGEVNGKSYENPITYFVDDRINGVVKNFSAIDYFNGSVNYYKGTWAKSFGEYIN